MEWCDLYSVITTTLSGMLNFVLGGFSACTHLPVGSASPCACEQPTSERPSPRPSSERASPVGLSRTALLHQPASQPAGTDY